MSVHAGLTKLTMCVETDDESWSTGALAYLKEQGVPAMDYKDFTNLPDYNCVVGINSTLNDYPQKMKIGDHLIFNSYFFGDYFDPQGKQYQQLEQLGFEPVCGIFESQKVEANIVLSEIYGSIAEIDHTHEDKIGHGHNFAMFKKVK